jgi:biofilm PGA synthesis protein PgaD
MLLMGSWSQYNRLRFAGKQRRRGNRALDIEEMAPALSASLETAKQLRKSQRSIIRFTQDGHMMVDTTSDE